MKDLFGEESLPALKKGAFGNRIAEANYKQLIAAYGETEGQKCKNCIHLIRKSWDKVYLKCGLARQSNSMATDWRAKWPACGKFELEKKEKS